MQQEPGKKLIFDTDIGGDCDDAGALALIHRLCDHGEAELLAVTHCYNGPYYAGCIDAINHFFGRTVPVGINLAKEPTQHPAGVYAAHLCEHFPNRYPPETYRTKEGPEDTLTVLRRTLAAAEDQSVTLVVTGAMSSMARLVRSGADDCSAWTGKELIARKICRTVLMGGRFFETWPMVLYESGNPTHHVMTWEYNIRGSGYEDAVTVFAEWPGELMLSSYEIGTYLVTMVGYAGRAAKGDPVAAAYQLHNHDTGRCSWDHTAVLEAVRPGRYWHPHAFGRITVDTDMVTHWHAEEGARQSYLLPKVDYEEIRQTIDDLLDGKENT